MAVAGETILTVPEVESALAPQLRENAVLIYGPRKAGTTLLQRLLDGSSLYVYPTELKVKQLAKAVWTDNAQFLQEVRQRDRLLSERIEGFDHPKFETEREKTASQAHSLRDAILLALEAAMKASPQGDWTGWAAKEVGGDFEVIFNDWKKMFPGSKVLVILRNPFFVSRSVFGKRYRARKALGLKEVLKEIVHPWQIFGAVAAYVGRKDLHLVYYEDLVADTEPTMRSVARFLDVGFLPKLTHPTMFGTPVVVATSAKETTSVFRERKSFWTSLGAREAMLLGLIGGAICLKNLAFGRIIFKNGALRLAGDRRQAPSNPVFVRGENE
jgi:hypothetical protein